MTVVLGFVQGLLAIVVLGAGASKLARGKAGLATDPRMGWVEEFSATAVRNIGALEVAAALGLVLPWVLGVAPVVVPLAATGVLAIQLGAVMVHRRRQELKMLPLNGTIALFALVVAVGRLGLL